MATTSNTKNVPLASAVDAEINKFRNLQEQLHQARADLQVVIGQHTENEMVQTELNLMSKGGSSSGVEDPSNSSSSSSGATIYKRIGPVLIRQNLEDAQQTVSKRLEYISSEQNRIQNKIKTIEEQLQSLSVKIQTMQADLQRTTAEAVQAIAQQHHQQQQQS